MKEHFDDNLELLELFIELMPDVEPVIETGMLFCENVYTCTECKLNNQRCVNVTGVFSCEDIERLKEKYPELFI